MLNKINVTNELFLKRLGVTILFLVSISFYTTAQSVRAEKPNFLLEYIDISSGLSNNYVSKIAEGDFGRMWFASEGGLNAYNGKNFKLFRPNQRYSELLNENIETVFVDKDSRIWVGTKSGGVSVYDQVTDEFKNLKDILKNEQGVPAIRITDFAQDANGDIWISTWAQGLYRISGTDHQLIESYVHGTIINALISDTFGNVWAASNGSLFKFDPSENRLIRINIPIGVVMGLHFDKVRDQLLVGSSSGLYQFNTRNYEWEEFSASQELGFQGINAINVDSKGQIWIGSWTQGLYLSDPNQSVFKKFTLMPGDPTNTNYEIILDIYIDKNEFIWVGTGYGGVVKINPKRSVARLANTMGENIGLPDNNIQAITLDKNGAIWVGTWGGGIGYSTDRKTFRNLPGMNQDKVSAFYQWGDTMFVGTSQGLRIYDVQNPQSGPKKELLDRVKVKDLFVDSQNKLWIGTQQTSLMMCDLTNDAGLSRIKTFNARSQNPKALDSERISKVVEDREGNIWVGTYNGLYLFNASDSSFTRMDDSVHATFPSVIFLSILPSDSGHIWLGMPGGLIKSRFENGQLNIIKQFDLESGLGNDYVTAVTEDNHGNIWISNASGLASIRNTSEAVINLTGQKDRFYSMNINSIFNSGDRIYFGSSNGLLSFDPVMVELIQAPPRIIFDNLKIDNKDILVGQEINGRVVLQKTLPFTERIEITHRESIVSIGFLPTDFRAQSSQTYHYRILGLHSNWINNGNSDEISFIGLNSGNYTLEVRSSLDNVHFGEISRLEVKVIPPPWLSTWAFVIYFFILVFLVYLISQFFVSRAKLQANLALSKMAQEKEHELNEAKLRFFTNISHELRTPLTLIITPIEEIMRENKLPEGIKERFTYIDKNARRLLELINQLIDFRKAEQGELKLKVAQGNFIPFAKEIFLSFKGYAESQGVTYEFQSSSQDIPLIYDRDKMEMLLCNLLSNAFKFTSHKGNVLFSISEDTDACMVSIRDSGKGISKEYQEKIFNRFFQIQDAESAKVVGSGIGLSLSQKIAQLHHGELRVESNPGEGTVFILRIPKNDHHFNEEEVIQDFKNSDHQGHYGVQEFLDGEEAEMFEKAHDADRILIVDDNTDVRSYLQTIFKESGYEVFTAENGLQGVEIAQEESPDLIISDVMMPEMDGLELCKILKEDIRTSHIPIILLTARTSTVYEVDGLNIGADDYVKKPFDASVIKSKVASFIENRQKVRSHLINKFRFESNSSITPVNREEKFIEDLYNRVGQSLLDNEFNIDVLADELCMSQSTLYRKIKSLTGLSITGFIRSVRLKKASELLLTEDLNLSQVAYKVGFNDYKYFKKSFLKQFGVNPGDYKDHVMERQEN